MHHLYAEDSQLCISFTSDYSANHLDSLKTCIDSVWNWMLHNRLKLNPSKTDLIGREQQQKKYLSRFPITLMGIDANPSASVRNVGVVLTRILIFGHIISQVCSSCFYHICDLRRIRRHLNLDNTKSLACALVTSRLDYCNSVLQGVAGKDLESGILWAHVETGSRPFADVDYCLSPFAGFLSNLEENSKLHYWH